MGAPPASTLSQARLGVRARRRRWGFYLPNSAVILLLAGPGLRNIASESLTSLVSSAAMCVALILVIVVPFVRTQHRLYSSLQVANADLVFVIVRASPGLNSEIREMSGIRIGYPTPRNASLAFVDAGTRFELWRLRRGGPERVLRIPWATVSSVAIATVSQMESIERAVEVTGTLDGHKFRIGLPPQRLGDWLMRPQKDSDFMDFFNAVKGAADKAQVRR